jgi:hypothetical protein
MAALAPALLAQDELLEPDDPELAAPLALAAVDLSTAPAAVLVRRDGRSPPERLVLGRMSGALLVVAIHRIRIRSPVGLREESEATVVRTGQPPVDLSLTVAPAAPEGGRRPPAGPSGPLPGPRVTRPEGAAPPSAPLELLAGVSGAAGPRALVSLGGRDHLLARGETAAGHVVEDASVSCDRELIVTGPAGSGPERPAGGLRPPSGPEAAPDRGRLDARERVSVSQSATIRAPGNRRITLARDELGETLREPPAPAGSGLGHDLRLVSVLDAARGVARLRQIPVLLHPGARIGRWEVRELIRRIRPGPAGEEVVEQGVRVVDLFTGREVSERLHDRFRADAPVQGDDPHAHRRPPPGPRASPGPDPLGDEGF